MKVHSPSRYNDDRIDSLMMACYPFLIEEGAFSSTVVDYENAIKDLNKQDTTNPRFDKQWDKLKDEAEVLDETNKTS